MDEPARGAPTTHALAHAFAAGVVGMLLVLGFFATWTHRTGESLPLAGDNQLMQFPITYEAYRGWSEGRIPEWTTRIWSGYPLLADPIGGPLYIPHLVAFALTPPPHFWAYELTTAFHSGLFVAGAVFLLRLLGAGVAAATFGGVLFLFAPFSHQWAVHLIPQHAALAYWPWLFAAAERLRASDTSAVGGFAWLGWVGLAGQIMGGYPEFAVYSGLVAALWMVALPSRRPLSSRILRVTTLALGGLALAAPQLLATAEVLAQSVRGEEPNPWLSHALSNTWTAPLQPFVTVDVAFTTLLGFGTIALAAIAVARRGPITWLLATLAGLGFVLSLGPKGIAYDILHAIPPLHLFRGPIKFWQITEVSVALLAALGADVVLRKIRTPAAGVATGLALLLLGGTIAERGVHVALRFQHFAQLRSTFLPHQTPMLKDITESGLLQRAADGASSRTLFAAHPELMFGSMNVVFGIDSLRGGPAQLLGQTHSRSFSQAAQPGLLDRAGVRFVLAHKATCEDFAAQPGWNVVERRPGLCLLETESPASRYEILHDLAAVDSAAELAERIREDPTQPVGVVVDPGEVARLSGASGRVDVLEEEPGRARLRTYADQDALLLVRESWAPGWQATIAGAATVVRRAAGPFFAVELPRGEHVVDLQYRGSGLRPGVAIALAWSLIALGLAWRERRLHV